MECHKTENKHYAIHYGATIFQDALKNIVETQEAKPPESRNLIGEGLLAIGILVCIGVKVALNSGLRSPVDKRYSLYC